MIGPAPSRPVREISAPKVRKGEPGSVRLQGGRQAPSRGPGPQETPGGRGSGTLDKPRLDALALFPSLCFTSPLRERTPQPRMEPTARTHSCLSGRSTVTCVTLTVHISHPPPLLQWQPRTALRLQNGGPAPARRAAGGAPVAPNPRGRCLATEGKGAAGLGLEGNGTGGWAAGSSLGRNYSLRRVRTIFISTKRVY